MKKHSVAVIIIILIAILWFLNSKTEVDGLTQDFKTGQYEVGTELLILGTNKLEYFGNEVWGDFNDDGRQDVAFLIEREQENGQKSYYVTAAFNLIEGYEGMNAIFLGNDISPQGTEYKEKIITVHFGKNNTESPTIETTGVTKFFLVSSTGLRELGTN